MLTCESTFNIWFLTFVLWILQLLLSCQRDHRIRRRTSFKYRYSQRDCWLDIFRLKYHLAFKHFYLFIKEFDLVEPKEMAPLQVRHSCWKDVTNSILLVSHWQDQQQSFQRRWRTPDRWRGGRRQRWCVKSIVYDLNLVGFCEITQNICPKIINSNV